MSRGRCANSAALWMRAWKCERVGPGSGEIFHFYGGVV